MNTAMNTMYAAAAQRWTRALSGYEERLQGVPPPVVAGQLTRMVGLTLEASGCRAAVETAARS